MIAPNTSTPRLALFLYSLDGGGAERVMANLANSFSQQGIAVDLLLVRAQGPYLSKLLPAIRVIELKASKTPASLWDLIAYLRRERPFALLSVMHYANEVALLAKLLSRVPTKVFVCEQNNLSRYAQNTSRVVERWTPLFAKLFYPWADGVIAASQGVAKNLNQITGIPESHIRVIYNPVITIELKSLAQEPVDHPWFADGELPVILGVGRLVGQKDFPTLIRAFAQVRKRKPSRLMILGSNAGSRPSLENLIRELDLEQVVAMPGFAGNPYNYMAKSGVFVLSSAWEGFGNVLAEALAVGTPVVSTDCESGPSEILDQGRYGKLVPIGDDLAMAEAILEVLDAPPPPVEQHWLKQFSLDYVGQQYLDALGIQNLLQQDGVKVAQ
jgi:glycosyltransferase involved in cell wall biosynthesis